MEEIKDLAKDFSAASKEAKEFEQKLKMVLAQLVVTGQNGSKEFKKVQKQLNDATAEVKKYENALASVGETSKGAFSNFNFADTVSKVTALSSEFQKLSTDILSLDKATSGIRSLGGEAARIAPALEAISLKMAKDLPFSAAEFQSSFQSAILGGVKGGTQGLVEFNETAAKLAVGGMAELQDASKSLSTLLREFGASSSESEKYANTLFSTVKFGLTSIPELNASLSQVVPSAAAAGIAFDNIGAALALMTKNGTPTADATSKLNKLITELQKPGDALAHTMHKAGVSLATLKNDGLPATLERIRASLQETGKASSQAFSSPEAAEAFKTLTKSSGEFSNVLSSIQNDVGSTDRAYSTMASSMSVQSKQLTTSFQAFILEGIKPIAPAFTAMSTAFNVAGPILQTGAAIKSLLPTVAAQTAATGAATTAQVGLNFAMLANPAVLITAGIVGLTIATAALSHAVHETAVERKTEAEAHGSLLEIQKKDADTKIAMANSTYSQIDSYKKLVAERDALIGNTKRSADEEERLKNITSQLQEKSISLANTYPGAIKGVQDYSTNVANLSKEAENSATKLVDLNAQSLKLTKDMASNEQFMLNLEVAVQKEGLEDQLTSMFDANFFDSFKGIFTGGFDVVTNVMTGNFEGAIQSYVGTVGDMLNTYLGGFGGELSELIFGTSDARQQGEAYVKQYSDGLYNAKDSSEVNAQVLAFNQKVIADTTLKPEEKNKLIKGFAEVAKARVVALDGESKALQSIKEAEKTFIVNTFNDVKKSGGDTNQALKDIAGTLGISAEKAKELAIGEELKKATKEGKLTEEQIKELAVKYNLPIEKVKELQNNQEAVKGKVQETISSVDGLAKAFSEASANAGKALGSGTGALAELLRQQDKLRKEGKIAEANALQTRIDEVQKTTVDARKNAEELESYNRKAKLRTGQDKSKKTEKKEDLSFEKEATDVKKKNEELLQAQKNEGIANEKQKKLDAAAFDLKTKLDALTTLENEAKKKAEKAKKEGRSVTKFDEYQKNLQEQARLLTEENQKTVLKIEADGILAEQKLQDEADAQKRRRVIAYDQFLLNSLTNNLTMTEQVMERLLQSGAKLQQEEMSKLAENKIKIIEDANKQEQILEKKRREDAIAAIVDNSYEVKRAQENVDNKRSKGKNNSEYLAALKALEEEKQKQLKSNEEVIAIRKQAAEKEAQDRIAREYKFANIRATAVQDTALRERDLAVAEAKYLYDQEILLADGNRDKEIAAEMHHQQQISKIVQRFIIQSNQQKKLAFDFATSLQQKFRDLQIADNSEAKKALNREEDDLRKSLAKREISYHEYTEKLNEIDQKRSEFSNIFQQIFTATTQTMVDTSKTSLDNYVNKYVESINLTNSLDEESTEAKQKALVAQEEASDEAFAAMGAFAISSAAAQIAAGKSVAQATLNALLDTLVAAVPIFVAMKFGENTITGAFVSAALLGLVAAAKASVASAKFAKGGIAGKYGEQQIIVGEEGPEAIIPARITRKYKPQILQMIDGKNPATIFGKDGEIHREVYVQTDPHLYKKVDQLTGQVEKLAKSTEQYALSVRRQTTIDVGGQVKVGLDGKEAIIQLQRATARRAVL